MLSRTDVITHYQPDIPVKDVDAFNLQHLGLIGAGFELRHEIKNFSDGRTKYTMGRNEEYFLTHPGSISVYLEPTDSLYIYVKLDPKLQLEDLITHQRSQFEPVAATPS